MTEKLKDILAKVVPFSVFEESTYLTSREVVLWLPLIPIGHSRYRIGVTVDGKWVMEGKAGLVHLDSRQSFIVTLPLLEEDDSYISEQIHRTLNSVELSVAVEQMFPITNVVRMGMEIGSDYWAALGLNWFDKLSLMQKQQLMESLDYVSKAKWASQKVRQKAARELRTLQSL